MISAGNDIVSFAATNFKRTKQPAFYSKILSEPEIAAIGERYASLLSIEVYVWLLWSVKEAVYKFQKRLYPETMFSPTRIIITRLQSPVKPQSGFDAGTLEGIGFSIDTSWAGVATVGPYRLYFRSLVCNDLLHTVVNPLDDFDNVYWGIQKIADSSSPSQSAAVRAFALNRVQSVYSLTKLQIEKDEQGIPLVTGFKQGTVLPVSFSHHGHFIAYSFNTLQI
ncbi:hypothetical protein A0256_07560 [Mucilaginibacter sp. PAMC 26640]|nr:hypothetical protein A0256_07560 [Mucilaginibacter sp. PAMC 26640]